MGGDVITLSRDNLEKVWEIPRPTTKKQVRSFLGLVGYYRDHIPAFAEISAPLSDLLKSLNKYNGPRHRSMLTHCSRNIPATRTSIELPDLMKPFVLRTDASGVVATVLGVAGERGKVASSRLQ